MSAYLAESKRWATIAKNTKYSAYPNAFSVRGYDRAAKDAAYARRQAAKYARLAEGGAK